MVFFALQHRETASWSRPTQQGQNLFHSNQRG